VKVPQLWLDTPMINTFPICILVLLAGSQTVTNVAPFFYLHVVLLIEGIEHAVSMINTSHSIKWAMQDLNLRIPIRPPACKTGALPSELIALLYYSTKHHNLDI
jgi:hypothetical protein